MRTPIPLLDNVRVASPCPAVWEKMESVEGDRVRFCADCKKNVFNISAMTRREAEDLIEAHNGRLCVRFYRRQDGTILTADCPVGKRLARRLFLMRVGTATALLALMLDLKYVADNRPMLGEPTAGRIAITPQPIKGEVEPPQTWTTGIVAPSHSTEMGDVVPPRVQETLGKVAHQPEEFWVAGEVSIRTAKPESHHEKGFYVHEDKSK